MQNCCLFLSPYILQSSIMFFWCSSVERRWSGLSTNCKISPHVDVSLGKILNPVCEWVWVSSGTLCVSPCLQCMYGGVNGVNVRCSVKVVRSAVLLPFLFSIYIFKKYSYSNNACQYVYLPPSNNISNSAMGSAEV